jgi:hypothetical protein
MVARARLDPPPEPGDASGARLACLAQQQDQRGEIPVGCRDLQPPRLGDGHAAGIGHDRRERLMTDRLLDGPGTDRHPARGRPGPPARTCRRTLAPRTLDGIFPRIEKERSRDEILLLGQPASRTPAETQGARVGADRPADPQHAAPRKPRIAFRTNPTANPAKG